MQFKKEQVTIMQMKKEGRETNSEKKKEKKNRNHMVKKRIILMIKQYDKEGFRCKDRIGNRSKMKARLQRKIKR